MLEMKNKKVRVLTNVHYFDFDVSIACLICIANHQAASGRSGYQRNRP